MWNSLGRSKAILPAAARGRVGNRFPQPVGRGWGYVRAIISARRGDAGALLVQLATSPLDGAVDVGMTILDLWLQWDKAGQAANDVAVLVREGGGLERILTITRDQHQRPWLSDETLFRTAVNGRERRYVICSARYPAHLIRGPETICPGRG